MHLYTDKATEALKFQMTCPSHSRSAGALSVGRVEESLAWRGPLPSPGLLGYWPMAEALKREFLSRLSGTNAEFTGLHSPTDEHVFLWKDHTESGSLCCFQIWPALAHVARVKL